MELSTCRAERDVVSTEDDDFGLAENSVVLNLGLTDNGTVVGEYDQLGLSVSQCAQRGLVP